MNPPASTSATRRDALRAIGAAALAATAGAAVADPADEPDAASRSRLRSPAPPGRVEGLLLGALVGDALGGPVEFQPPNAVHALAAGPKAWRAGERLDAEQLAQLRGRCVLRGYGDLRPEPDPYAHWSRSAPPGTVTDDSRHKMVLAHALRSAAAEARQGPMRMDARKLAGAYLDWPDRPGARPEHASLARAWLGETQLAARWVLGERDLARSLPPERLWNGLPTCMGQMLLTPLAAAFVGDPRGAYLAAHALAVFDNGWAKDLIGSIVAGLSVALAEEVDPADPMPAWRRVRRAMESTDPLRYSAVPWCERAVVRWGRVCDELVRGARGEPARVFAALDARFAESTKWEAQVPLVVAMASIEVTGCRPAEAMQLAVEWGHDTDSDAQLTGALVGALHGADALPSEAREAVSHRLDEEYGESIAEWASLFQRPLAVDWE